MNKIILDRILNNITLWSKGKDKLLVGIDGYSGAGKTTLLKQLVKKNQNILPVFEDDFIQPEKVRKRLLAKAKDKSKVFELYWNNLAKVRELFRVYRAKNLGIYRIKIYNLRTDRYDITKEFDVSKKVLILEGIFLFHPKLLNKEWDKRIYLDVDLKKADEKRIKREQKKWGKKYIPETDPASYTRLFKIAHERYRKKYQPKKRVDLITKIP